MKDQFFPRKRLSFLAKRTKHKFSTLGNLYLADRNDVKSTASFHQILETKILETPSVSSENTNRPLLTGVEPKHLSSLFEVLIPRARPNPSLGSHKSYQKQMSCLQAQQNLKSRLKTQSEPKSARAEVKKKARIPGPTHKLGSLQNCGVDFFRSHQMELLADFTRDELKQAYRQLALKLHPDRGGSAKLFIELKNHYENLVRLF